MTDIRQIFGKPKETTETVEMITITKKEYDKLKKDSIKLSNINFAGVDECSECKGIYDGRDNGWHDSKKYGELSVCDMCVDTEEEDEEDLEEEDAYWCVDCGKDFDWIKGKSYSGQGVNSYHCGICDKPKWAAHNKRYNLNEEGEEIEKCNICDIRLGMYDGKYEMKVVIDNMLDDGFKSYNCCGRCALDRVKRKTFERNLK